MMFEYFTFYWTWADNNADKHSPTLAGMYFYLLRLANDLHWKDSFMITSTQIMNCVGIGNYKTYKKHLDQLIEFGLIEMIKPSSNQYTANVIGLVKNTKANTKALPKQVPKQYQSTSHIHKTIKDNKDIENIKDNKENIDSNESLTPFNFELLEPSYIFKKQNEVDLLVIFNDPQVNKAFQDYIKHRITIKKPATKNAIQLLQSKLRKECGSDKAKAIELLQLPVMNNWIGIVWDKKNQSGLSKPQQVSFNRSNQNHYK
jgi:hypothetical protein